MTTALAPFGPVDVLITADDRDAQAHAPVLDSYFAVTVDRVASALQGVPVRSVTVTQLANVHPGLPPALDIARRAMAASGFAYVHTVFRPSSHR